MVPMVTKFGNRHILIENALHSLSVPGRIGMKFCEIWLKDNITRNELLISWVGSRSNKYLRMRIHSLVYSHYMHVMHYVVNEC